jgi:hypothetical protein
MSEIRVSEHAETRMIERLGIHKKSVRRIATRAFDEGLTHREVSGKLGRWVDGLYLKHRRGNQIRLYGDKAFIFQDEVLVTVIPIPQNMMKQMQITKEKVSQTREENDERFDV